jgi:hypothetical protein
MHQTKNYMKNGGDELHVGGKLIFDTGGTVEGLPHAAAEVSGGVIADAKTADDTLEAKLGEDGKLYVQLPAATDAELGGVKQGAAQADSTAADVAGVVADLNALLAKLRTGGVLATAE